MKAPLWLTSNKKHSLIVWCQHAGGPRDADSEDLSVKYGEIKAKGLAGRLLRYLHSTCTTRKTSHMFRCMCDSF